MKLSSFHKPTIRGKSAVGLALTAGMIVGLTVVSGSALAAPPVVTDPSVASSTTLTASAATYTFSQQPTANMNNLDFAMVSKTQEAMFVKFDTATVTLARSVKSAAVKVKIR